MFLPDFKSACDVTHAPRTLRTDTLNGPAQVQLKVTQIEQLHTFVSTRRSLRLGSANPELCAWRTLDEMIHGRHDVESFLVVPLSLNSGLISWPGRSRGSYMDMRIESGQVRGDPATRLINA